LGSGELNARPHRLAAFGLASSGRSGRELVTWAVVLVAIAVVARVVRGPRGLGGSRSWYRKSYLRSAQWRARAARARSRAGNRCERCGQCRRLDVHHLSYARLGRERDGDLCVLCRDCHEREHHPIWWWIRRAARRALRYVQR
jgi:hypothetical protein